MPKIDVTDYVKNALQTELPEQDINSAAPAVVGYGSRGTPIYDPVGIKNLENKAAVQQAQAMIPIKAQQEAAVLQATDPIIAKEKIENEFRQKALDQKVNYADSMANLSKALGMFQNQSAAYKEGIDAGVAGNRMNYIKGNFESWLGGEAGDKASAVGRIQSASRDTMFMMAPVLMQSKRFMASVQSALMKTMPQGYEGPKLARDKIQQDAWNLYRLTRTDAYKQLTPEVVAELDKNPTLRTHVAQELIAESMKYQPDKEELQQVNQLIKSATGPLNSMGKDQRSILERDYPAIFNGQSHQQTAAEILQERLKNGK